MQVYVEKPKCTGCAHCFDVCPVAVFQMKDRGSPEVNNDVAPENDKWKGATVQAVHDKWANVQDGHKHFAEKYESNSGGLSVAVEGPACILCQACLVECEGECIVITDDTNNIFKSIYK